MSVATGARILAGEILHGQVGQLAVSFTAQTSFTVAVTFPVAFPAGSAVNVHTNIASGSGSAAGWNSRAFNVTNSGFTLLVFGSSATWSSIAVQWSALCKD